MKGYTKLDGDQPRYDLELGVLGLKIKEEREKQNISLVEMQRKIKMSTRKIKLIEEGQVNITYLTLVKICKALNTSVSDLLKDLPS